MPTEREVIRAALKANPEHHAKLRQLALAGKLGTFKDVNPDEPLTIIASPDHFGITGAKMVRCGACQIAVWLSPSTQALIKARDAAPTPAPTRVMCGCCFGEELKERCEEKRPQ
jgi:hypothetical protein